MYPIAYLRLSIVLLFVSGCASDYKMLQTAPLDRDCLNKIKPEEFQTNWYNASIDIIGKHISGLVLVKNMEDGSSRVVFTNEAGVTFFDFGFSNKGTFTVHHVIHQLDKKPVLHTLQKDFELILGLSFRSGEISMAQDSLEFFYGVSQKKETAYFITPKDCASLRRLEWRSGRKKMVSVEVIGEGYPSPRSLRLKHHTFNLEILLNRIPKE